MDTPVLRGKYIIKGKIEAKTGLHIGGSREKLEIGGLDMPIIRDALTNRPYIPGSSLKGKMRALLERAEGKKLNKNIGTKEKPVRIHVCEREEYKSCKICKIFGIPSDKDYAEPTRLIVRDAFLSEESAKELEGLELPYSEVKWENAIDRITSAANPRQVERVPPGAVFDFEIVYNVFTDEDKENMREIWKALKLIEHDYLGGQGTRGYGKVEFKEISVWYNPKEDYESGNIDINRKQPIVKNCTPSEILERFDEMFG